MPNTVRLSPASLQVIRTVNDRLMSYNVEFTEVTGGTFWKQYTPEQIAGTEKFTVGNVSNIAQAMASLVQVYPPIDLYNEKLRKLAKEFGPVWVRVSGTWATKTYYDFEGTGVTPEGYQNRLTREQWIGVLDFVKAVGGKLLISMANCIGLHTADEPWNPSQAEKIFALTAEHGGKIDAVEFTNEPNMLDITGFPPGYTAADFARDQDIFHRWVRDHYPDTLIVGPCATGDATMGDRQKSGGGIENLSGKLATTDELMAGTKEPLDVFNTPTTQYHIRIETTQQRNNNVTQFYLLTTQDDTTTETLLQDNGFGIQSLIGFVLQIYFIIQHNQAHILFLDESLTAISTDKLPKLKLFINEVSKQYNFHFILIAHMESLFQLADYSYSVHNGKVTPIPVNNS